MCVCDVFSVAADAAVSETHQSQDHPVSAPLHNVGRRYAVCCGCMPLLWCGIAAALLTITGKVRPQAPRIACWLKNDDNDDGDNCGAVDDTMCACVRSAKRNALRAYIISCGCVPSALYKRQMFVARAPRVLWHDVQHTQVYVYIRSLTFGSVPGNRQSFLVIIRICL